ncbi:MAG: MFS transporter [Methylacidiphilales bacterium]|nr:MFS transporter [Candidatus Methylacidiphilales bacterium]
MSSPGPIPVASIAASDRVPFLQKIMFSAGGTMDFVSTGLLTSVLWMPYFNIGLGMSPALLGVVLMVLRGWDAFVDPVMGNFSDNLRTRWGRRRPCLAVGAVLTAALFPWFWRLPAHWSESWQVAYLIVLGMIFFASFSCWSMPYYGLQLELTPNYDERTRLTAWMSLCSKFSGLGGGWILAVLTSQWFNNPITGKPDIVHAVQTASWFFAVLILITGMLPPLFVKERYYKSETSHQPRDPLWQSIRESVRCRPLWFLIGISFFLVLGDASGNALGQYMNIYYINRGHLSQAFMIGGWVSSATFVTGIVCIPFWTWMGEKFDKKTVVCVLLTGGVFGNFLNYFCLRPDMPYLQMVPALFGSMVITAVWLYLPSMKADVADYDELDTHRRREGALNAFYSWFIKAALTTGAGVGGCLVQFSGFRAALVEQPPEVLQHMRWIYLSVPALFYSCTIIFIWHYPLNRKRMAAIRAELEIRRGKM